MAALLGLGPLAAVVTGGQTVISALAPMVGSLLSGLVTPSEPVIPPDVDAETFDLVVAWLSMLDPAFQLAHIDPARQGQSFEVLGGCGREVNA